MKNFFTYITLLAILTIVGCDLSGSESSPSGSAPSSPVKPTTASSEPIAPNVPRFENGVINLAGIPNNGAYVLTFAAPLVKEESDSAARHVFSGTVMSRASAPNISSRLAETADEAQAQNEDDGSERLFSPADRQRLMDEATAEDSFATALRGMAGRTGKVFAVGDVWDNVKVVNWVNNAYFAINAECIGVSESAYFMMEVGSSAIPPELLQNYMEKFDNSSKTIRTNFAHESDVDGNGKVIILFYNMNSTRILGYFNPVDKSAWANNSNHADIFYINIIHADKPSEAELINFTLAHEFQHMVFQDTKNIDIASHNASIWLNEGLSMLAGYVAGFYKDGSDSYVKGFISNYHTLSLTNWTDRNYGYSMLFTVYLYDRFGAETIKRLYTTPSAGWRAVEEVTGKDFNTLFSDFVVALAVSGRGYTNNPRYNFKGIDFNKYLPDAIVNLTPIGTLPAGSTYDFTVYPYGLSLREISGTTEGLSLEGPAAGFAVIKK